MIQQTNDVFILNGYVYWKYIWSEYIVIQPGYIKETFKDQFFEIDYEKDTKKDCTAKRFYLALALFNRKKKDSIFFDTMISKALERIWLAKILYASSYTW